MEHILDVINQIQQEKRGNNISPSYALGKEIYERVKGCSIEDIKTELNRLYKSGRIKTGRTINSTWIEIND